MNNQGEQMTPGQLFMMGYNHANLFKHAMILGFSEDGDLLIQTTRQDAKKALVDIACAHHMMKNRVEQFQEMIDDA